MRVIGGEFRSRKLKTVDGMMVRPTPDRMREALFNVLSERIAGAVFTDAYAGSGAVGIEALSRGARKIVLIEKNAQAVAVIRENLASLGVREKAVIARGSAAGLIAQYASDIAFIDPPYERQDEYGNVLSLLGGTECPLVVAQHESKFVLETSYGELKKVRVLRQGDNSLTFFERPLGSAEPGAS